MPVTRRPASGEVPALRSISRSEHQALRSQVNKSMQKSMVEKQISELWSTTLIEGANFGVQ